MIRQMTQLDIGVILNYLTEEYVSIPNGEALVTTLRYIIDSADHRYTLETKDRLIIGYYVYNERTPNTAELASVFIAPEYRKSKYAKELWVHGATQLYKYKLVKCNTSYAAQKMPKKYYNSFRHTFDIKKLFKKLHHGK